MRLNDTILRCYGEYLAEYLDGLSASKVLQLVLTYFKNLYEEI